jgi:hypothetical protein
VLVAIRKWQLAVRKRSFEDFFHPNHGQTEANQYKIFIRKSMVKYIFKKKQLFCLSHEKAARKHVDEINARLQDIVESQTSVVSVVESVEMTNFTAPHSVPLQWWRGDSYKRRLV